MRSLDLLIRTSSPPPIPTDRLPAFCQDFKRRHLQKDIVSRMAIDRIQKKAEAAEMTVNDLIKISSYWLESRGLEKTWHSLLQSEAKSFAKGEAQIIADQSITSSAARAAS